MEKVVRTYGCEYEERRVRGVCIGLARQFVQQGVGEGFPIEKFRKGKEPQDRESTASLTEIADTEVVNISYEKNKKESSLDYTELSSKDINIIDDGQIEMDSSLEAENISAQDFAASIRRPTIQRPTGNGVSHHLPDPDFSEPKPPEYIATESLSSTNRRISRKTISSLQPLTQCPLAQPHLWPSPNAKPVHRPRTEQASTHGHWRLCLRWSKDTGNRMVGYPVLSSPIDSGESCIGHIEPEYIATISRSSNNRRVLTMPQRLSSTIVIDSATNINNTYLLLLVTPSLIALQPIAAF